MKIALILFLSLTHHAVASTPERDARVIFCSKFLAEWETFETLDWSENMLEDKRKQALALIRRVAGPEAAEQARKAFNDEEELTLDSLMDFMSGENLDRIRSSLQATLVELQALEKDLDEEQAGMAQLDPYQYDHEVDLLTAWNVRARNRALEDFHRRHFDTDMAFFPDWKIKLNRVALVDLAKTYGRFVAGRPFIVGESLSSEIQFYVEHAVVQAIFKMDGFRTLFHMVSTKDWKLNEQADDVLYSAKENTETLRTLLRMVFVYELFYPGSIDAMQKYYKTAFVPWLVDKLTETKDERPYGLRYSIAMVLALMETRARFSAMGTFFGAFEISDDDTEEDSEDLLPLKPELKGRLGEHIQDVRKTLFTSPVRRSVPILQSILQQWNEERQQAGNVSDNMPAYEKALDYIIEIRVGDEDRDNDWSKLFDSMTRYIEIGNALRSQTEEDTDQP